MPANLPPQYSKAEHELRNLSAPADRLEKLREMLRLVPKHKGTEKLQAELKQKIRHAREEVDGTRQGHGAKKTGLSHRVPHEGAGQVVLVGPPNAGKSALVAALTHAHPEVAAYPFTTRVPQPGMMPWNDVAVQLVDLPPITADVMEPWLPSIVRAAHAAWLVLDLADDDALDATEAVLARLAGVHTELVGELPFDADDESIQHVKTLLVANKLDAPGAGDRLELATELFGGRYPILAVSAQRGDGLETLAAETYDLLQVIRIYTKVPGKPADRAHPFTLPVGSTIEDLARAVHRDLAERLKFAKVWGTGVFDGQAVRRDHPLHDADVVELHA
jgi:ribosome-interacting GTPase 1